MGKAKKYALLAGVEEYQPNSRVSNLKYAVRDAVELGKALRTSCGFDHVCVFAGGVEGSRGPANQNDLIDELEDWANIIEPDDLFVFAFIGHGMEQGERGYLLPADARLGRPNTFIELKHLNDAFEKIKARQRVVLLDCCRNDPEAGRGDAANAMSDVFSRDIATALKVKEMGQTVSAWLTACGKGERAYEWDRVKHGVFTYQLLKAIRKEAWSDGRLTVNAIGEYVQEKLGSWGGGKTTQTPQYQQSGGARIIILAEHGILAEHEKRGAKAKVNRLDDPSGVKVENCALDPFEIELEEVELAAGEKTSADLPPIPDEIRKLQGEIMGLEQAIAQIEDKTHPSLKDANAKVRKAGAQFDRLESDRDRAWKKHGGKCPEQLEKVFEADPDADVFAQDKYCPQKVGYTDYVDLVYRARNTERARKAMKEVEGALATLCGAKQDELKKRRDELRAVLLEETGNFLENTIIDFLRDRGALEKDASFPGEAFIPFARSLGEYGFALPDKQVWELARQTAREAPVAHQGRRRRGKKTQTGKRKAGAFEGREAKKKGLFWIGRSFRCSGHVYG